MERRLLLGAFAIVCGAAILSSEGRGIAFDFGSMLIAGACVAWRIDNNLTRKLASGRSGSDRDDQGYRRRTVNCAIAFARGAALPTAEIVAGATALGFMAIGISVVMFVLALRHLGTARTGAYFSFAPFHRSADGRCPWRAFHRQARTGRGFDGVGTLAASFRAA